MSGVGMKPSLEAEGHNGTRLEAGFAVRHGRPALRRTRGDRRRRDARQDGQRRLHLSEDGRSRRVVADGVSQEELIAWCEARLARFKVPKSVHFVAEIPRNGMGKVQKQELRQAEPAL
jgi:acyl-CoA synthetase (AMP-forming)/AMP-acid ligase II